MATPGFPLPLRNALAALACDALDDDDARAALAWLAEPEGAARRAPAAARLAAVHLIDAGGAALLDVHAPWARGDPRARRARAARRGRAPRARRGDADDAVARGGDRGGRALERRALLRGARGAGGGLAAGDRASAARRSRALIQIAVAWHHLAHGNPRGARTLLREGRARLTGPPRAPSPASTSNTLLTDTAPWEQALLNGTPHPRRHHRYTPTPEQ